MSNRCHNPCFSRILFAIEIKAVEHENGILSQSLFQQNTLCNSYTVLTSQTETFVTILVLVEYSLQQKNQILASSIELCHNPCFSRILFAIIHGGTLPSDGHLSQSLFQQNTLCNDIMLSECELGEWSQSLFQQNTLCNDSNIEPIREFLGVTILVLVEYSLQLNNISDKFPIIESQSLFQQNTLCNRKIRRM